MWNLPISHLHLYLSTMSSPVSYCMCPCRPFLCVPTLPELQKTNLRFVNPSPGAKSSCTSVTSVSSHATRPGGKKHESSLEGSRCSSPSAPVQVGATVSDSNQPSTPTVSPGTQTGEERSNN
jgi:hypothetical protein